MATIVPTYNKFTVLAEAHHVFEAKPNIRFDATKASHRNSKAQYRNYINLDKELAGMKIPARRGIVTGMIKRLTDPVLVAKESNTHVLIYQLRLQAMVWAFFGGHEFVEIANRDLSSHPGYEEAHTEAESAILFGFFTSITNFRQNKIFTARSDFNAADKAFGALRHAEWLVSISQ